MRGVLQNPKKSFRIEGPIPEVKSAVEYLHLFTGTYKLYKAHRVLSQFTYEATEFLGVNAYIDINIFFGNKAQTEITIEVRPKIGSFGQDYQITEANNHIVKIIELITESINAGIEGRQAILDELEVNKKMKAGFAEEEKSRQLERKQNFLVQYYYTKLAFRLILLLSLIFGIGYLTYKMLF